jgi:hypothetical protein
MFEIGMTEDRRLQSPIAKIKKGRANRLCLYWLIGDGRPEPAT